MVDPQLTRRLLVALSCARHQKLISKKSKKNAEIVNDTTQLSPLSNMAAT